MTSRLRRRHPEAIPFVGLDDLAGRPHVMVDGTERPGSVLVLSHWPATSTPRALWRDLSVEIALAYLDDPRYWTKRAECVSLDHLDEDGIASAFVLAEPETALEIAAPLVGFARSGDFGSGDRRSMRAVFAMRALFAGLDRGSVNAASSALLHTSEVRELIGLLGELVTSPERFSDLWSPEDEALERSEETFEGGDITLEERPEVGVAVVRARRRADWAFPLGKGSVVPYHPFALHSRTAMPRVLALSDGGAAYYDRYETWVRYVSRRLPLRRDLTPLADVLCDAEPDGTRWLADPPGTLVAALTPDGGVTELAPAAIEETVVAYLRSAPAAWDPFRRGSPLVAVGDASVSGSAGSRSGTSG